MIQNTKFTLKECLETADNLLYKDTGEHLQYWEKNFIKHSWHKMTRRDITELLDSKKSYYKISHLFGHKVPEIRRKLSKALGEPITRSSFKEPLRRQWQRDTRAILTDEDLFINHLVYANKSINYFTDLEIEVMRESLKDKTYQKIAENTKRSCKREVCKSIWECKCNYPEDYIRGYVGSNLFKKVSPIMGVEVNKRNCIEVFETWQQIVA